MNLYHCIVVEVLCHEDSVQKQILDHVNSLIAQTFSLCESNYYLTVLTMNNSDAKVIMDNIHLSQSIRLASLPFDESFGEYYGEYARIGKAVSLGLDIIDSIVYKLDGTAYFNFITSGYDNSSDISRSDLCRRMQKYRKDFGWHFSTTLIRQDELQPDKHFISIYVGNPFSYITLAGYMK